MAPARPSRPVKVAASVTLAAAALVLAACSPAAQPQSRPGSGSATATKPASSAPAGSHPVTVHVRYAAFNHRLLFTQVPAGRTTATVTDNTDNTGFTGEPTEIRDPTR
ncbi:MAG: hypothetical protein DLM59_04810 [Pseudonocardiales bacterium]|nr:MAG: hypothetical protein DLM59_04810 [Pseudonocardiales bacterium]